MASTNAISKPPGRNNRVGDYGQYVLSATTVGLADELSCAQSGGKISNYLKLTYYPPFDSASAADECLLEEVREPRPHYRALQHRLLQLGPHPQDASHHARDGRGPDGSGLGHRRCGSDDGRRSAQAGTSEDLP